MKKTVALLSLLVLLLAVLPAMADTVPFGPFSISLPGDNLVPLELSDEDQDAGMMAAYMNDRYMMCLLSYDCADVTLREAVVTLSAECSAVQSGIISLNGIDTGYYVYVDGDGEYQIEYLTIEDGTGYGVGFSVLNSEDLAEASSGAASVMETLTRAN